jgi:hypothetical protein
MNTKIVAQRLAKFVGSEAKGKCAVIKEDSGALHVITLGFATAVVVASVSPALAIDSNATQMASLTGDRVTAMEDYPNPGGNYVQITPSHISATQHQAFCATRYLHDSCWYRRYNPRGNDCVNNQILYNQCLQESGK